MPSIRVRRRDGSPRRTSVSVRRPRATLALVATIVTASVVFSGGVGDGALPTASLPEFGVTGGNGSLSTVAELGDINGDGFGDYAIGMPSADVGASVDAGIVYVFLGRPGALPPTATSLNPAAASFQITGRGSEMLGYAVVGNDVNRDGLSDIAIGAPMAGAPPKAGGGAVYVVFGSRTPAELSTNTLSFAGYTNTPTRPATPSPLGSRYDGFQQNGHTGMSLAALPDVNGDGYRDLAVGAPDASLHTPGGGGVAVLYGKALGVHITLNDLWENGYPFFFHIDYPAIPNQHVGMSVASVGDMTGDGWPDIAVGAPQADPAGRIDAGSVWIISGHLPPIVGCTKASPAGVCPWIKLRSLSAAQGYRIDGPVAGAQLGSALAGAGDQNGDGVGDLAIGQAGASPLGRARAGAVVVVPGQRNAVTRDLAVTAPLQTVIGPAAGAALGSSLAAAGSGMVIGAPGDSSSAGAVYEVQGAAGTSDLALAAKIAPAAAGSMAGSAVAAGSSLDGGGADVLVAAPGGNGSGGWFVVGG
jgi:FG-GAP repeat